MDDSGEVELIDYLRVLWKRKRLILIGTLASMSAALGWSLLLPDVYQGSMVLEVGKVYSVTRADQQEKMELIEDPKSFETILLSNDTLQQMKGHIGDDIDIQTLRRAIEVDVKSNPLAVVSLKLREPQAIVRGLTFLAERIIGDHQKKHDIIIGTLDRDITSTLEKMKEPVTKMEDNKRKKVQIREKIGDTKRQILIESEQIKSDSAYGTTVQDQVQAVMVEMNELKTRLSELDFKKTSPLEILFLQTTLQNYGLRLADFKREVNDLKQRENEHQKQIAERQKQAADLEIQMNDLDSQNATLAGQIEDLKRVQARLENFRAISENTRLRSIPVVFERPISPRKGLFTSVAGSLALMILLMSAFFLEYLEKMSEVPSRAVVYGLKKMTPSETDEREEVAG